MAGAFHAVGETAFEGLALEQPTAKGSEDHVLAFDGAGQIACESLAIPAGADP